MNKPNLTRKEKQMYLYVLIAGAVLYYYAATPGAESGELMTLPFLLGPVINRSTLSNTTRGFKAVFTKAYQAASSYAGDLAMRVDSSARQEEYRWLGALPGLTEWLGDRAVKDVAQDGFIIKNRDFEATVSVGRNDIEDDSIGAYAPLFSQLGESARQHPDELVFSLMKDGFTNTCFDGELFFDVDHPNGSQSTWSNKGTSALSAASYETGRQTIMSYINEEGKPLRLVPTHLIVPPQLEKEALDIIRADKSANGASNVWINSADIIVAPELAGNPTYWFLACLNKPVKPFILQMRQAARFVALDNPDDENVFMRKKFIYGVDYRGAVGYGLPHLIYGSTGGA